jgi:Fic family protein
VEALKKAIPLPDPIDSKDRYLHWDDFRFKSAAKTPSDIVTEWMLLKAVRTTTAQSIPLQMSSSRRFSFNQHDAMRRALHGIDLRAGATVTLGPDAISEGSGARHLQRSIVEEPFSSSVLEGAATTRAIARKMIEENRPAKSLDEKMVLNNYRAMQFVKQHKDESLTPELVLELHRIVTEGTLENAKKSGVFRSSSDDIKVVDDSNGQILHAPPKAETLEERMNALCIFANQGVEAKPFIHPLLRAAIIHFMLAYDHPFVDGNGRTARALFYWSALRAGYWLFEYVSISSVIKKSPIKYGRAFLLVETDAGDLTYFLDHQIETIRQAVEDLHAFLDNEAVRTKQIAALLKSQFNLRQATVIQDALKRPLLAMTIIGHERTFGVSYLTARKDLDELAAAGYLSRRKNGTVWEYRAAPGLDRKFSSAKS